MRSLPKLEQTILPIPFGYVLCNLTCQHGVCVYAWLRFISCCSVNQMVAMSITQSPLLLLLLSIQYILYIGTPTKQASINNRATACTLHIYKIYLKIKWDKTNSQKKLLGDGYINRRRRGKRKRKRKVRVSKQTIINKYTVSMKPARVYIVLARVAITFYATDTNNHLIHTQCYVCVCYVTFGLKHIPISVLLKPIFVYSIFGSILMNVTFDLMNDRMSRQNRKKINKRCRSNSSSANKWSQKKAPTINKLVIQSDSNGITILTVLFFVFASPVLILACVYSTFFGFFFPFTNWLFKDHDLILKSQISLFWLLAGETNANILEQHSNTQGDALEHIHSMYHMGHIILDAFRTHWKTDTIQKWNPSICLHYFGWINVHSN